MKLMTLTSKPLLALGLVVIAVCTAVALKLLLPSPATSASLALQGDQFVMAAGVIRYEDDLAIFEFIRLTDNLLPGTLAGERRKLQLIESTDLKSEYSLTIDDTKGTVLSSRPLIDRDQASESDANLTLGFVEILDFPNEGRYLRIRKGDKVLFEAERSAHAPTVDLLPVRREKSQDGWLVEWEAKDEDGDVLLYDVLYSHDGGESWRVLSLNQLESQLTVAEKNVPGGDRAVVRVVASDLFNTSHADSMPFVVPNKPPSVFIVNPRPRQGVLQRRAVLTGASNDLEDGQIVAGQLVWSSDKDGELGRGREIWVRSLSPGKHQISLRATDREGLTQTVHQTLSVTAAEPPPAPPEAVLEAMRRLLGSGTERK